MEQFVQQEDLVNFAPVRLGFYRQQHHYVPFQLKSVPDVAELHYQCQHQNVFYSDYKSRAVLLRSIQLSLNWLLHRHNLTKLVRFG